MRSTILATAGLGMAGLAAVAVYAQAPAVQPGQWEVAVTINSMEMAGAPPGLAKMLAGRTTRAKYCLTPEQAARGPQDMMKANKSCKFTRYSATGGKLNSEMTCTQGGSTMTATTSGSFTPTSFTATGRAVTTGAGASTVTTTSVGRRLGDCG